MLSSREEELWRALQRMPLEATCPATQKSSALADLLLCGTTEASKEDQHPHYPAITAVSTFGALAKKLAALVPDTVDMTAAYFTDAERCFARVQGTLVTPEALIRAMVAFLCVLKARSHRTLTAGLAAFHQRSSFWHALCTLYERQQGAIRPGGSASIRAMQHTGTLTSLIVLAAKASLPEQVPFCPGSAYYCDGVPCVSAAAQQGQMLLVESLASLSPIWQDAEHSESNDEGSEDESMSGSVCDVESASEEPSVRMASWKGSERYHMSLRKMDFPQDVYTLYEAIHSERLRTATGEFNFKAWKEEDLQALVHASNLLCNLSTFLVDNGILAVEAAVQQERLQKKRKAKSRSSSSSGVSRAAARQSLRRLDSATKRLMQRVYGTSAEVGSDTEEDFRALNCDSDSSNSDSDSGNSSNSSSDGEQGSLHARAILAARDAYEALFDSFDAMDRRRHAVWACPRCQGDDAALFLFVELLRHIERKLGAAANQVVLPVSRLAFSDARHCLSGLKCILVTGKGLQKAYRWNRRNHAFLRGEEPETLPLEVTESLGMEDDVGNSSQEEEEDKEESLPSSPPTQRERQRRRLPSKWVAPAAAAAAAATEPAAKTWVVPESPPSRRSTRHTKRMMAAIHASLKRRRVAAAPQPAAFQGRRLQDDNDENEGM